MPSVAAALSLATAMSTTVERLFGTASPAAGAETWAWKPTSNSNLHWRAEVAGKTIMYPADSAPTLTELPDREPRVSLSDGSAKASETLVIASCDPAAGVLASQFAATTGLRMIVLPRSSRKALEMLREGLVHLAGVHLSTSEDPDGNARVARTTLTDSFRMVRLAQWQEGIALAPSTNLRSVRATMRAKLSWVGREVGSGARQCLDQLFESRPAPHLIARNHRQVVDAVQSGWADAGVCVRLVSEEAGLTFMPVQEEMFDMCFPSTLDGDRRIKAFVKLVQSASYRRMLGNLPGYDTAETGNVWNEP